MKKEKDLMNSTRTRHGFIKKSLQTGGFEKVDTYFDLLDGISYVDRYNEIYKNDIKFYNTQMKKMYGGEYGGNEGVGEKESKGFFKKMGNTWGTLTGKKISPNVAWQRAKTAKKQADNNLTILIKQEKEERDRQIDELEKLEKKNKTNKTREKIQKLKESVILTDHKIGQRVEHEKQEKQRTNYEKQQQNEQKRQENRQRESNRRGYDGSQYRPPQRQSFGEGYGYPGNTESTRPVREYPRSTESTGYGRGYPPRSIFD
jgi:hypothetical protein